MKEDDDNFEYRYTVIFPNAKTYSVDDILNFISAVEHHLDSNEWNEEARNVFKEELIERLLKSVVERKFELWDISLNRVAAPPANESSKSTNVLSNSRKLSPVKASLQFLSKTFSRPPEPDFIKALENPPTVSHIRRSRQDYKTTFWWARMTFIYKSDLVKFCRYQRILATFEDENEKTTEQTGSNQDSITKKDNCAGTKENAVLLKNNPPVIEPPEDNPAAQNPPEQETPIVVLSEQRLLPAELKRKDKSKDKSKVADDKYLENPSTGNMHPSFINFNKLPDDAYVSMEVVCALFGCSESTVVRRTQKGMLKKHSMGVRDARWNVGELRDALKKNKP